MGAKGNEGETLNLIWGCKDIAKFIGRSERATFGLLEGGQIPATKINGKWVTEREKLTAFFMMAL